MEHAFLIGTLVGMRPEVVALGLDQVSRQHFCAVAVVVGNGRREGRNRDTVLHGIGNHVAQRLLVIVGNFLEVRCQQQVGDIFVFGIGIGDLLQELGADDAAGAEDFGDFAVVQIPVVFVRRRAQLREALRVGDDFAEIQRAANFLDEIFLVAGRLGLRTAEDFRGSNAL